MKRLLSILICLSLCFTVVWAEDDSETEHAIFFAQDVMQSVIDRSQAEGIDFWGSWRLTEMDPQSPRKAAIVHLTNDNAMMVKYMADRDDIPIAFIAEHINTKFSTTYAEKSRALTAFGECSGYQTGKNVLVWLVYDYHTFLLFIHADSSWEGALIMADRNTAKAFSADYIQSWLDSFFIFNADIEVLESMPIRNKTQKNALGFAQTTVQMMKDQAEAEGINLTRAPWDISLIDPEAVLKAAVVTISDRSLTMMQYMASEGTRILEFISNYANSQFSEDYTKGANALLQAGDSVGFETEENILVFAVYEFHICLCLIRADGSWESCLMMSDRSVLKEFNEEYVAQALEQFFISDAKIAMIK